ncbi:MAG: universal stress protein [Kineosporiaceae bacterium]
MSVVVGYVPTREGRAALDHGVREAVLRGVPLVVVSSRPDRPDDDAALEGDLAGHVPVLVAAGLAHERRQLPPGGDTADDILALAHDVKAQLIVVGLRRRSPVGKLLLGSIAQRILLDASCPVLAVKGVEP